MKDRANPYRFVLTFICGLIVLPGIGQQLKADFTTSATSGCVPVIAKFSNTSTGTITSYRWELGDGTVSTEQNPGIIYNNPGTYTVKLIVTGPGGSDTLVRTDYIHVYSKPVSDFAFSNVKGCNPTTASFTDLSTPGEGSIVSRTWDFGDGLVDSTQNPLHTYVKSGTFGVLLKVTNTFGCSSTLLKQDLVTIYPVVGAAYTPSIANPCAIPVSVHFGNGSSSTSSLTYAWDFGDGSTSTAASPDHVYQTPGTYAVSLVATSAEGCRDSVNMPVTAGIAKPTFTVTNACFPDSVHFSSTTSPAPNSVRWDFGDGVTSTLPDAAHKYSAAGTYTVKLTSVFGACSSTSTQTVTVMAHPKAALVAPNGQCQLPANYTFVNQSTGATHYLWSFGDGTTSTDPTHTYMQPGDYSPYLVAYNDNGCTDTAKVSSLFLGPPVIDSIKGLDIRGCAPLSTTLTPYFHASDPIATYFWEFGDGTTSAAPRPSHVYGSAGAYTVSLTITTTSGCSATKTIVAAIVLDDIPKAQFQISNMDTCGSRRFTFTNQSTGNIDISAWNFGDNHVDTVLNTTHGYGDTGTYTVTLTVITPHGCTDKATLSGIHVTGPIAHFGGQHLCADTMGWNFYNVPAGEKFTSVKWDFGDGTTSADTTKYPFPVHHTYADTGKYYVSLTVTNSSCSDIARDSVYVLRQRPTIEINTLKSNLCKGDSVELIAHNYNTLLTTKFKWTFGDGSTIGPDRIHDSVFHKYTRSNTFRPSLTITDTLGCTAVVTSAVPVAISQGPTARFSNPASQCFYNGAVHFTNTSTGDGVHPITQLVWAYGDGARDTLASGNTDHAFAKPGSYNTKLIVQDSFGCLDSAATASPIVIAQPVAGFAISDSIKCPGNNVTFSNSSTGAGLVFLWNFGDATSASVSAPTHAYVREGSYNVSLRVIDQYGCRDSVVRPAIRVALPHASFTLDNIVAACPPFLAQPHLTATDITSVNWNFGDNNSSNLTAPLHYYTIPGHYTLKLIVQGYGQCFDSASSPVTLKGPSGRMTYTPFSGCSPLNVAFSASTHDVASLVWDFNDGNTAAIDTVVTHNYPPGNYLPKLVIIDSVGCKVTITNKDSIHVGGLAAGIGAILKGGCDSTLFAFRDSSSVQNDVITSDTWDFGDQSGSNISAIPHNYLQPGHYSVRLHVTTRLGCVKDIVKPIDVNVYRTPRLTIIGPDSACLSGKSDFRVVNAVKDTTIPTWKWTPINAANNGSEQVSYVFETPGTYQISVSAGNPGGCEGKATHPFVSVPSPRVSAGVDDFACLGKPKQLTATGADAYAWAADSSLSCTDCATPLILPKHSTIYAVTGRNTFGCESVDSVSIELKRPTVLAIAPSDTICLGSSVQLNAKGAELYQWYPATALNSTTVGNPVSSPRSTIIYTVVGMDNKKCFSDTTNVLVKVYPIPEIKILQTDLNLNAGFSDTIHTKSSSDITQWAWSPARGLSCYNCPEPVVTAQNDITYTLVASNPGHCVSTAQMTIHALCNGANIFVPNTFSPNHDGMNDAFYPRGRGLFTIKSFRIFNRWGQIVFEKMGMAANNASDGWNGTFQGQPASSDVYVYIMEVVCENNTLLNLKGNVTLIR